MSCECCFKRFDILGGVKEKKEKKKAISPPVPHSLDVLDLGQMPQVILFIPFYKDYSRSLEQRLFLQYWHQNQVENETSFKYKNISTVFTNLKKCLLKMYFATFMYSCRK